MTYSQTIQYLYSQTPVFEHVGGSAYKAGLDNTLVLDEHLGHPHRLYKTIHVAGTNGKGSCSHMLASILQADGYRVGLYTSPHLVSFRERIRVNGECIPEQYVVDFVENNRRFFEPLHPSFFEVVTAMAFSYFAEVKVDVAVVEVGLGGRLDCTNIITPELALITNISLDHTQFLGHTLAAIASEKAGIIKKGVPVVVSEAVPETRPVFEAKAQEVGAESITFAQDQPEILRAGMSADGFGRDYLTHTFGSLHGDLCGDYQDNNVNAVLTAVKLLIKKGVIRHTESVANGLKNAAERTGLMGRWQRLQTQPTVVCDTGHNVGGWQYLAPQLKAQDCRTLRIVFGMVDDKDVDTVMSLMPKHAVFYFTHPQCKRAFPVERVVEAGSRNGLHGRAYKSVAEAYDAALKDALADDFVFVGGSSYVVADLLTYLHAK